MRRLHVRLTQPASAARNRDAAFHTAAFPYVPGWVVRGALASAWVREFGPPEPASARRAAFIALFEGTVRFGPLLPRGASFEPLSLARCKYPQNPDCRSVLVDLITDDTDECPSCHRGIEQLKGALRGSSLRERTRVALDEHETARDGAMFTREEIPAESDLDGWIDGEHDWLASVEEMPIWVGGRRSTSGKGIASCSSGSAPDAGPITQPGRLVIRCATPLISLDTTGRPQLQPSTRELAARLGVDEGSIELERRFARPVVIGGWHQASGLPKPRELAAVPGSTFVYRVEGLTDRQCSSLAAHGLGHRTREGFGWIEVNPAPWVAPEPAAASAPRAAPRLASGALLELPLADRRWVADFIDDRRREVELRREAQTDGPQSVLQTDRVAGFDTRQRVEFEAALRSDDLTALKVLAAQLREAR